MKKNHRTIQRKISFSCILLFLFFVFICEAKSQKEFTGEVIKVNPHEATDFVNLSEIVDSIKLIPLKTEGNDVIRWTSKLIIKKKYIYVIAVQANKNVLFVFDKEGKFVSKLNKEPEPDKYFQLGHVFIDDNEEYLERVDGLRNRILKYSIPSFEFIESAPFPNPIFGVSTYSKHDGFYYFGTRQFRNNVGLTIVDSKNNVKTLFDKSGSDGLFDDIHTVPGESFTKNDKNELFMYRMFDNNFYRLNAGEVYPAFTVDFGKYGMDNEHVGSLSTHGQSQYMANMRDIAAEVHLDINNTDIMSFSYFFKQEENERGWFSKTDFRLYLKLKGKIYHTKQIRNDLSNFPEIIYLSATFPSVCSHAVWYEDYLVDVFVPERRFENKTDKVYVDDIGEITANDNPIVVMMKLKK